MRRRTPPFRLPWLETLRTQDSMLRASGLASCWLRASPVFGWRRSSKHVGNLYRCDRFLARRVVTLASPVLWLAIVAISGYAAASTPNVLILCADDHAAYVTGIEDHSHVRTPRLDEFFRQGTRFTRAYCNSPVCTASRQSFLTGRCPRSIGVTELSTPLPDSTVTLAEMLAPLGYRTAAIGKMHFNSHLSHGFELRLDMPKHARELSTDKQPPPPCDVLPAWKPFADPARVWLNAAGLPLDWQSRMAGTWFVDQAIEFLRQHQAGPFFLMVSLTEPHSPFHFPIEFRARHDSAGFEVPGLVPTDEEQVPAIFRDLTATDMQGICASYATSVEFVDHNVGRILDALTDLALDQNTLVIYLSDHGYMLGQHGRFEKHCCFEEAIRVPFAWRLPGSIDSGQTSDALVELVDLVPTILELVGAPRPAELDGLSLANVLTGRAELPREHVFVEYAPNDEAAALTLDWKLIYQRQRRRRTDGYDSGQALDGPRYQLYQRSADPHELTNLADDLAHQQQFDDLKTALEDHLLRTARIKPALSATANPDEVLELLVQPNDVRPGD